jgi:hypothetical protein
MRKLFKTIRLSFSLALTGSMLSANIFAQSPIARVTSVKGDAFVNMGGKLSKLQPGQNLFEMNTITTGLGAQVAFNDFFDHVYHLAGEGQVQIRPQIIQLHRGYFWIQSLGKHQQIFQVTTANAKLYYSHGHGVLSFDADSGRTQFMSVQGVFGFGNLLQPELDVKVTTGEFSFVDNEFQEGVPRYATAIGRQTFDQVVSLFPGIKKDHKLAPEYQFLVESKKESAPSRAPASVEEVQAGSIIYIPISKQLSQTQKQRESLIDSYKAKPQGRAPASVTKQPQKTSRAHPSNVEVRVFGSDVQAKQSSTGTRAPASVAPSSAKQIIQAARSPASLGAQLDVFEKGLQRQYQQQQPHSDEVNQLLRELKNYQMDLRPGF